MNVSKKNASNIFLIIIIFISTIFIEFTTIYLLGGIGIFAYFFIPHFLLNFLLYIAIFLSYIFIFFVNKRLYMFLTRRYLIKNPKLIIYCVLFLKINVTVFFFSFVKSSDITYFIVQNSLNLIIFYFASSKFLGNEQVIIDQNSEKNRKNSNNISIVFYYLLNIYLIYLFIGIILNFLIPYLSLFLSNLNVIFNIFIIVLAPLIIEIIATYFGIHYSSGIVNNKFKISNVDNVLNYALIIFVLSQFGSIISQIISLNSYLNEEKGFIVMGVLLIFFFQNLKTFIFYYVSKRVLRNNV